MGLGRKHQACFQFAHMEATDHHSIPRGVQGPGSDHCSIWQVSFTRLPSTNRLHLWMYVTCFLSNRCPGHLPVVKNPSWVPNTCDPAIPILDSDPKELKTGIQASTCTFHSSISHNRQKVRNNPNIHERMDV